MYVLYTVRANNICIRFILIIVYVFVYFTNTRVLLAKVSEKLYIYVVVYKTKFHERFYFCMVYILTHFVLSLHLVNINSVASDFMTKTPIF